MNRYMKGIAILVMALPIASNLSAQQDFAFGYIMTRPELKTTDMLNMSQYNQGFGTARSTAMGGAFTSLGGDLAVISLNPAGLGMYRSSDIGFTPALTFTNTRNSHPNGILPGQNGGNRNRFEVNNFAAAFNLYQGKGALTSFTLAIGYNKLADFSYRSRIEPAQTGQSSIVDIWASQLRGISPGFYGDRTINHSAFPCSYE